MWTGTRAMWRELGNIGGGGLGLGAAGVAAALTDAAGAGAVTKAAAAAGGMGGRVSDIGRAELYSALAACWQDGVLPGFNRHRPQPGAISGTDGGTDGGTDSGLDGGARRSPATQGVMDKKCLSERDSCD